MKIKMLGTCGDIKPNVREHSHYSGVLVNDELLLDFGEKEFLSHKLRWIFVTHLHPDHAVFIKEPVMVNVPIYAPEPHGGAKVTVISKQIKVGPYTVTPIPTSHSTKVKSMAYLVSDGQHLANSRSK